MFKYDTTAPDLLHIYVRHLTTPEDAIRVFFDPSAQQSFNQEYDRFERYTSTHGLYWFWRIPDEVVMVITCFTEASHG